MSDYTPQDWAELLLSAEAPEAVWPKVLEVLEGMARNQAGAALDRVVRAADTLLADSAWELWHAYPTSASRTAVELQHWWGDAPGLGRAVLIVDALSLRELKPLLDAAKARGDEPTRVRVTGAELPTTTDAFAHALGASGRSALRGNRTTAAFHLEGAHTDVLDLPLEDALARVPAQPDLVLWYTRIDDALHSEKSVARVHTLARDTVTGHAFWALVDRLRQGRRLVVTSDHGYADSYAFHEEEDEGAKAALRSAFGASRSAAVTDWTHRTMPPLAVEAGGHLAVLGQRKWKVTGGYPGVTHGGATLLEAAVPWVEFAPRA